MDNYDLYRNVYRLIDKKTGQPKDVFEALDTFNTSRYEIEAINPRISIKDQYQRMYQSVNKTVNSRNIESTQSALKQKSLYQSFNDFDESQLQGTNKSLFRPKLTPLHLASDEQYDYMKLKLKNELKQALIQFQKKQNLEFVKFTRENLKQFLATCYRLTMTELLAIEGIHYCRGKLMEKSQSLDVERLVDWLVIEVPILQKSQQARSVGSKVVNRARFTVSVDAGQSVEHILKSQPSQRQSKKVLQSLLQLDAEVQKEKSRQGILAQIAAQKRLSDHARQRNTERELEIQRQLVETCHFDSAVRSINLAKYMNPTWSETPNSYRVISQLTERQKRRLHLMTDKRLEL